MHCATASPWTWLSLAEKWKSYCTCNQRGGGGGSFFVFWGEGGKVRRTGLVDGWSLLALLLLLMLLLCRFLDPVTLTATASYQCGHQHGEPVTCIGSDKPNTILVVAGGRGTVTVWEVVGPEQDKAKIGIIIPVSQWRGSSARIDSVGIIEHPRLLDTFVLVCATDGVSVWTLAGSCVGKFGQVRAFPAGSIRPPPPFPAVLSVVSLLSLWCVRQCMVYHVSHRTCAQSAAWNLDDPTTYRNTATHWVPDRNISSLFGVNFRRAPGFGHRSTRKRRASVSDGLVFEGALAGRSRSMPEPGQVWVRLRRTGDMRQRREAAISQRLPDPCGCVPMLLWWCHGGGHVVLTATIGVFVLFSFLARWHRSQAHALDLDSVTALITVMRVSKDTVRRCAQGAPERKKKKGGGGGVMSQHACLTQRAASQVIGWNGLNVNKGETMFVPIAEFTAPDMRSTDLWTHHRSLTRRVGHIFRCVWGSRLPRSRVVLVSAFAFTCPPPPPPPPSDCLLLLRRSPSIPSLPFAPSPLSQRRDPTGAAHPIGQRCGSNPRGFVTTGQAVSRSLTRRRVLLPSIRRGSACGCRC